MSNVLNVFRSFYYQFLDFIQQMHPLWFLTIWLVLLATCFLCIAKFYKLYNGEQKKFEKLSLIILAVILFAILVVITYIRN